MKIGKRLLSLLLCLAMLLSMLSTFVFAETANDSTLTPLPTGDVNSLTGAKPTTDVTLTINANAIVVDGSVAADTTNYVLNWNGKDYAGMFTYGTNLFASLADAQAAAKAGDTVLVKSLPANEVGAAVTFTVAASFYTENYNTLPYVIGTAFDGSDWTANEEYAAKSVTLGNVNFILSDADPEDGVAEAGTIALYGFSISLSGTAAMSFNNMPDVYADFVIQNSAMNISGGNPAISATTYADTMANSKGASMLFKNIYLTGSCTRVFTEYVTDYFTLDGWYVPDDFADTVTQMYLKTGISGGKSRLEVKNCNFQGWKGYINFQMLNGKNWFANRNDAAISGAPGDFEWRTVYLTNNTLNNSSLWQGSAFHQVHSNATSKTVISGNRIINTGAVVPLLKNNHATYANYFTLEMYNNYIEGYTDSPDFGTSFMGGGAGVAPYADIRNNYFSDNTEAKLGIGYTVSRTGDPATNVTATDWYLDANMTFLNSAVDEYLIKDVTASNGSVKVYNLSKTRIISYNLKEGTADLKFTFATAGASASWYSDAACANALDISTVKAGDNITAYLKVMLPGRTNALVYSVKIFKSDSYFADDFTGDELLTKDMLLVSNMNDDALAAYSTGAPVEYTLPHDGKTYTFIKGVNAFSNISEAIAFATEMGIVTPSVYFDYSNEGESISISHSVKIIAPNYNVKPFDDKGFSESDEISDGIGTKAWTYNTNYDANRRTVADFKFVGNISPVIEVYGVELKSYLKSGTTYWGTNFDTTGRSAADAACSFVFQNILVTNAVTGIFNFGTSAGVEDDTALIKNFYVRSAQQDGVLNFNSNYLPETTVIDGLFFDYNALGTDNKNSTKWWFKQGNSENTLTIKNSNLRNFYNETAPFWNFLGNGENPADSAGSCKLIFEHNILYNFATGTNAFLGFFESSADYTSISFKNNYVSAPAGMSLDLMSTNGNQTGTALKIDIVENVFKGLKDFGAKRPINSASDIRQNYSTAVSSSDNTLPGQAIVLNGQTNTAVTTVVSKNHYLDYAMKLLNTEVAISNVTFGIGTLEVDEINYKYTGIVKEGTPATVADFTFELPDAAEYVWYEDSELTKAIANEDLSKVDMYYTPIYLKVYAKGSPDQYIAYSFDLKTNRTPANLFTQTFVDPAGVIDRDKAMIVSGSFKEYSDGSYVETNFADETVYTFIKGENAFDDYTLALDYAEENGIDTPHILILDYTGMKKASSGASAVSFTQPAHYFTKNYNTNPVISGTAMDGSDWSGNIGEDEGQFNPDNSFKVSMLSINATAQAGEYKFYGFVITSQIKDNTLRKRNISIEFVNTYFNRATWNTTIFSFGTKQTSLTPQYSAYNESFVMKNTYLAGTSMTATGAKLFEGTVPATVIIDNLYMEYSRPLTSGVRAYEFNCLSDNRSFQLRNSCLTGYFFKGNAMLMKNTQTGKAIEAGDTAEYIVDGCTLVNSCFNNKSVFSADLGGLTKVQITNNKVYNEDFTLEVLNSGTTTNNANIPLEIIISGNCFNAVTESSAITRTLADTSVIKDNYAVTGFIADVSDTTYGGTEIIAKNGAKTVLDCTSYYVDSDLECYATDAIPAKFTGDKTQLTDTGAKYLITAGDPVCTDNGDGTYTIDVSSIVKNPAGNKVEIKIGDTVKTLGEDITVTVDGALDELEVTVISYALEGDGTVEQTLLLCTKLAQISDITVGDVVAEKDGDTFSAVLASEGANEQIKVSVLASGTTVVITDSNGTPVTNVSILAGETKTYTVTATIGSDTKTYTLTVSRKSADKTELINELEELIEQANAAKDTDGKTWLTGAKDELVNKISAAYAAIDGNMSADALTQAYAELEAALENAESSVVLLEDYNTMLETAKAIDNADGKYCAPTYSALLSAISKAEADIETATTTDAVNEIILALDIAIYELAEHSFTTYTHNSGSENCNSDGTKTAKCDTAGCTATDTVAETGNYKNDKHNFTNYVYNNDATMLEDGTETGTCSRCGEQDTRTAEGTMLDLIDSSKKFKDVKEGDWFKEFIDYAASFGLMNGKSADTFDPNATITRAEFVQVLANMSGVDLSNKKNDTKFTDMKDGDWFVPAVRWAAANGIVAGKSATSFAPNAAITREEMCVMLVQYASFRGITLEKITDKFNFKDSAQISSWAAEKVYACQMAGLVQGDGTNFYPKDTAKRCEVAVIMTLFHSQYILLAQ